MTRPYPQIGPFTVARGEAGITTSVPVVGLNFKGAVVKLMADETLVTSTAIPWGGQVSDKGNWWSPNSATLFETPANVRQMQFTMGAYLTPAVADMQFYMLKNGAPVPGGGYSHTASGNVGFTWTSANLDTVEGDLWEMIPEFAAGAPVLDADEVGGTWLSIEAKTALSPSTDTRGALMTLAADQTAANYSAGANVPFDVASRDTDQLMSVDSAGVFVVGGGITHIKLRAGMGCKLVSVDAVEILTFWKNGAVMNPSVAPRLEMANADPMLLGESYVIETVSGDWFTVNFLCTDASITLDAGKCFFELEIVNPSYLANVDSYHGSFFAGVPTSEQETHRIAAPFAFTLPASLDGSTGSVGIAPNSIENWSFQKNGVEFAQATISLSGDVSFLSSLEQQFGPSDNTVLTFVAPNSGSAGNVSFVLKGLG